MPTVRAVLTRALRKSSAIPEGATPSQELIQDALETMFDLAGMWHDTEGIPNTLPNSTLETEVQEPRVVIGALVYELAVMIADDLGLLVGRSVIMTRDRFKARAQSYYLNDMRTKVDTALQPRPEFDIDTISP